MQFYYFFSRHHLHKIPVLSMLKCKVLAEFLNFQPLNILTNLNDMKLCNLFAGY